MNRGRWRLCFWLCFLLTPAAILLIATQANWLGTIFSGSTSQTLATLAPFGAVGTFVIGTIGAAYCLAKFHANTRTRAALVGTIILYVLGLAAAYAGILFVGCLILFEHVEF